jgi:hypothetical protein
MFSTQEEFTKILAGDLVTFNEVLSRIYNKSVEDTIKATPEITAKLIKTSISIRSIVDQFNNNHPEFKGHEDLVRQAIQEVELENPGATYEDIFKKAAPRITNAIQYSNVPTQEKGQLSLTDLDNKLLV